MRLCLFCVSHVIPRTAPSGLSPVVWTRCSVSFQHALGDCCCLHMCTGASASENHTPALETHIHTKNKLTTGLLQLHQESDFSFSDLVQWWFYHYVLSFFKYVLKQSEKLSLYAILRETNWGFKDSQHDSASSGRHILEIYNTS